MKIRLYEPSPDQPLRVAESARHVLLILSHRFVSTRDQRSNAIADELALLETITPGHISYHALRTYWLVAMTAPPADDLIAWADRATALADMFHASIEGEDLQLDLANALELGEAWLDAIAASEELLRIGMGAHISREISAIRLVLDVINSGEASAPRASSLDREPGDAERPA